VLFVVPVTVTLKGTVCPITTDVADGNTVTLIPAVFPPPLAACPPLQPAHHKMARVRRSFPSCHIVVPRTFTTQRLVCGYLATGIL
jgi:hypothetical protein